ncbi:MAG: glycosyltransferase [Candidatus Aenigmarchaeota archaeon]|nr:glycosyltransferase [Candidatus Aenigmarchaeota archaeon]MDW8149260.1 glycosyltransferase [Candidatus Aenigmarchaeota archaeon]
MKVLHLGKLCPPKEGGIEIFSYDLLKYLNSQGIRADLLCFGEENREDEYQGFKYYECKEHIRISSAPLSYNFAKKFFEIYKNYDLIHVHSPNPLAEFVSLFVNKPLIIHWHSDIVKQKILYKFYRPIQVVVLKKAKKIVCTSPNYLESSAQLKGFKDRAVVVPSGVDTRKITLSEDQKLDSLRENFKGKKIVLSIGRLVEYKGFEYLILAGKYLRENVVIVIAGCGPLYSKLTELIESNGLSDRVFLIGRVENVYQWIKECDIFCLPSVSRNEAFGLVLVEALFFGKPLVTTAVEGSGMNFVNLNGKTGLVVAPKNPRALADAINEILSDNELYSRFSINAKERFKEFDIQNVGCKILNLYNEVLSIDKR